MTTKYQDIYYTKQDINKSKLYYTNTSCIEKCPYSDGKENCEKEFDVLKNIKNPQCKNCLGSYDYTHCLKCNEWKDNIEFCQNKYLTRDGVKDCNKSDIDIVKREIKKCKDSQNTSKNCYTLGGYRTYSELQEENSNYNKQNNMYYSNYKPNNIENSNYNYIINCPNIYYSDNNNNIKNIVNLVKSTGNKNVRINAQLTNNFRKERFLKMSGMR